MRTSTEINEDIAEVAKKFRAYKNLQNEGGYGFNPYEIEIEKLCEERYEADENESPLKTKAGFEAEKIWFNAQAFSAANVAHKACQERGYSLTELQDAKKLYA